ncbi:hybrid sensor histidine kinase/response regulator [Altericroceibacterium xinjiangense]|uniref:hybrid sensor histidine kinase/response regulator n=1 Tax=Altericroceibacterium xinjiangense TaxID=762261 RepID=UPI000F7EAF81|nr:ATP-binding protein [Altericroceibacterium xinjiangense]
MGGKSSERALLLAPAGRDATVAAAVLAEAGIASAAVRCPAELIPELERGAGFVLVTEEALRSSDTSELADWIEGQEEWSDMPFILLTTRGGGLERNPSAVHYLGLLGNVTFLERPFHPTTLVSLGHSALRGRRRQYEARARLKELKQGEERYRSLFESIEAGFCIVEMQFDGNGVARDYRFVEANPAFERQTGLADVVGKSVRKLAPKLERHWLDIYGQVARTGSPARFEQFAAPLGRWFDVYAFPTADGARDRVAILFYDITQRRAIEQELRDLTASLEQRVTEATGEREAALAKLHEAQKIETLGQLTGGVAHDFNNLLTPITGALDLLQRRYAEQDPRAGRLIGNALESAERAKTLVQRLLGFARRQVLETRAVNIAALLAGLQDLIQSSIGAPVELAIECAQGLPAAMADPNQLEMALLNLAVNARDAMPQGGTLTIRAEAVTLETGEVPGVGPGAYLRICVTDTGKGMDEETLARATEPFYSTKAFGKGTGLGLSMVHGLASQMGGGFRLSSQPGAGTEVAIWLPVAEAEETAAAPLAPVDEGQPGRTLTILLVDDEPLVRVAVAEMLREAGHSVSEAPNGYAALAKMAAAQAELVISDVKMPHMDGWTLADEVQRSWPHVPVLLISGYTGSTEDQPRVPLLQKPFTRAALMRSIERLAVHAYKTKTVS